MYTIGQFSRITMLPVRTLRYYDQEGLLKPAQVNPETGYRYYTALQVPVVNIIRLLKEMEFPLETIRDVIAGEADIFASLEKHRRQVEEKAQRYQAALERMDQIIMQKNGGFNMPDFKVDVKEIPAVTVLSSRQTAPIKRFPEIIGGLFGQVYQNGLSIAGPIFDYYYDDDFDPENADFEVCIPVTGKAPGLREVPPAKVIFTTHVGPYDQVGPAYQKLMDEAPQKGLRITGPACEVYLRGPDSTGDPREYITEVRLVVEKEDQNG